MSDEKVVGNSRLQNTKHIPGSIRFADDGKMGKKDRDVVMSVLRTTVWPFREFRFWVTAMYSSNVGT